MNAQTVRNRLRTAHLQARRPFCGPILTQLHTCVNVSCGHSYTYDGIGIKSSLVMNHDLHFDLLMVGRGCGGAVMNVTPSVVYRKLTDLQAEVLWCGVFSVTMHVPGFLLSVATSTLLVTATRYWHQNFWHLWQHIVQVWSSNMTTPDPTQPF